jgi:hypothetical protein
LIQFNILLLILMFDVRSPFSAVTADLGFEAGPGKLAALQPLILKRIKDHSSSAAIQSSIKGFSGGARERVEGGGIVKGGLVRPAGIARPEFKRPEPRASVLGLQSLGQKKREENEAKDGNRRSRISFDSAEDGGPDAAAAPGAEPGGGGGEPSSAPAGRRDHSRAHYRHRLGADTPSHPGGVDSDAADRIASKSRRAPRDGPQVFSSSAAAARADGAATSDAAGPAGRRADAGGWEDGPGTRTPSTVALGGPPSAAATPLATPARTSVDQWDIVASAGGAGPGGGVRRGRDSGMLPSLTASLLNTPAGGGGGGGGDGADAAERALEAAQKDAELEREWYDNDESGGYTLAVSVSWRYTLALAGFVYPPASYSGHSYTLVMLSGGGRTIYIYIYI